MWLTNRTTGCATKDSLKIVQMEIGYDIYSTVPCSTQRVGISCQYSGSNNGAPYSLQLILSDKTTYPNGNNCKPCTSINTLITAPPFTLTCQATQ
jgi:hypothetical protein